MVVLDIKINNFYAFKNFHMNLSYPKKIVGSTIEDEHLANYPNFRYKKVNIIMGANASGKTSLGRMLMNIFNFLDRKKYELVTKNICNRSNEASFSLDLASADILYRISCIITPCSEDKYSSDNISVEIRQEKILAKDNYESCAKRIGEAEYTPEKNYLDELEKMGDLDWMFEFPTDSSNILQLPKKDKKFQQVLESIMKALDPSIQAVEKSKDVDNAYVIRLRDKAVIIQSGEAFTTTLLSSGTKAGVEIAQVVSSILQNKYSFYYCDEKFPYIHSDMEKAILSVMIDYIKPNSQLFFTTHNAEILDMNLPKHTFTFLRKDENNVDCPITTIDASSLLKRSTDSLKNAVENDMFSAAPAVDRIYALADI